MLFWLVAVGGFILLVVVNAIGWFYKLSPKVVKGASIAITMAAVLLSLSARREDDLRRDQAATVQQSN